VQQNEQTWVLLLASRDDMINSSLLPLPEAMSMWHTSLQTWLAKVPRLLHEIYLVGNSPPMRQLRKQLQVAQQTRAHVEMICPPGTGGAMIAAMLQRSGTAPLQAPITLDCALHNAESLGELLRGLGRLSKEHALSQHTIYCEQLHLLAPAAQSRLLKWLQAIAEPPRMIHSSPRSLAYYVTQGRFSADLAAELAIARIRVLPLRKRLADVPLLAQWCVEKWNATTGQNLSGVSPEALDRLLAYHWPENVDEFQRYLTQACEAAEDTWVQERDLPERLRTHWQALCYPPKEQVKIQLDQFLGQMEQEILERALREAKQNKSKAAELLGITRQRLLRRLTQFGLIKSDEETIDFQPLDPEANSQDMP
jgi:DNA-binding NtrC family response regulator